MSTNLPATLDRDKAGEASLAMQGKATWGSLTCTDGLAQPAGDLQPHGSLAYSLAAPDCDAPLGSRQNDVLVPGVFCIACCTLWTKACNSPRFRFETAQ